MNDFDGTAESHEQGESRFWQLFQAVVPPLKVIAMVYSEPGWSGTDAVRNLVAESFRLGAAGKLACLSFRRIGQIQASELSGIVPHFEEYLISRLLEQIPSRSADDEDSPAGEEGRLRHAVRQLPRHLSIVIVLHHFAGFPVERVAKQFGLSSGEVFHRLELAHQQISQALAPTVISDFRSTGFPSG